MSLGYISLLKTSSPLPSLPRYCTGNYVICTFASKLPIFQGAIRGDCQDIWQIQFNTDTCRRTLMRDDFTKLRAPGTAESAPAPIRTAPRYTWYTCRRGQAP